MDTTLPFASATPRPTSRAAYRAGWAVSALPILLLAFDVLGKLLQRPEVAEASVRLGLPVELGTTLGVLLATCLVLHLVPRTAVLGAVLLTGYLGGAVAIHLRVGDPLASHTLFPVWVGALLWLGLALRDARVRALVVPPPQHA